MNNKPNHVDRLQQAIFGDSGEPAAVANGQVAATPPRYLSEFVPGNVDMALYANHMENNGYLIVSVATIVQVVGTIVGSQKQVPGWAVLLRRKDGA